MADLYVFADEAGNFDFSRKPGATLWFILTTVTMDNCAVGDRILSLKRDLAWRGLHLDSELHAAEDPQAVRDEVFKVLATGGYRIDTTLLYKPKAQPHLQSERDLYKMAWFLHFKYVAPQIITPKDRLLVAASSLGTKKKRARFWSAVKDVVLQVSPSFSHRVAFWSTTSEPCLQVADYCSWAIQRKWEKSDTRSYDLIKHLIQSEYDVWSTGTTLYY